IRRTSATVHGVSFLMVAAIFIVSWPQTLPPLWREYSLHYNEGNADYYHEIAQNVRTPALVFVPANPWPNPGPYLYVAYTLPPTDESPIIFARDMGEHNVKLAAYYQCRFIYLRDERDRLLLLSSPSADCP